MHEPHDRALAPGGPEPASEDRRLYPRVAEQIEVTLYAVGLPAPVTGRTRDIGPQGLCVETESPIGLEGSRRIVLHLSDSDPTFKVVCCWQGDAPGRHGVLNGFRFVDLEPAQTEVLWSIVCRRAREVASFLCGCSELSGMRFDDAMDLAMHTRLVRFSAGDWIHRQGGHATRADSAYLVLRGTVAVEALNERAESVYLDHVEPGCFFGGLPMLADVQHPETATAETPCEVLEIDPFSYRYLLTDRPAAAQAVTRALVTRYARRLGALIATAPTRPRSPFHRFFGPREVGAGATETAPGSLDD